MSSSSTLSDFAAGQGKWRGLVHGFRATNFWFAFMLNALVIAGISVLTVHVDAALAENKDMSPSTRGIITYLIAFAAAIVVFVLFYILFGYGGGMLA